MHETFLDTHSTALVLAVGTFVAGAFLEWLVPFRERLATEGGQPVGVAVRTLVEPTTTYTGGRQSDKGTKRLLVAGMIAGLFAGWLAARYVPGAQLPGNCWLCAALLILPVLGLCRGSGSRKRRSKARSGSRTGHTGRRPRGSSPEFGPLR